MVSAEGMPCCPFSGTGSDDLRTLPALAHTSLSHLEMIDLMLVAHCYLADGCQGAHSAQASM